MPIYLRKFYTRELVESINLEQEQIKKANKQTTSPSIPKTPNINPRLKR